MSVKNYYATLGISMNANDEEIKAAYHSLARKFHPDHGGEDERFGEISEAYRFLSDSVQRIGLNAALTAAGIKPDSWTIGDDTDEREQVAPAIVKETAAVHTGVCTDSYVAELEKQIAAYEAAFLALSRMNYTPPSREFTPVSLDALVRSNRTARARICRRSTK